MDPNELLLSPNAYNAHLLRGAIEATAPANESEADATTRSGAFIEMFKAFAPTDAVESMIACHCVALQHLLMLAMRDASSDEPDPALLIRMRSSAVAISRQLHQWVSKLETMKARNETRAVETASAPARPPAEKPPRPIPPKPVSPAPIPTRNHAFDRPEMKGMSMKQALLATTELTNGVRPDGTNSSLAPRPG